MNLLACIALASAFKYVSGHAYMYWPTSREAQRNKGDVDEGGETWWGYPAAWGMVAHTQRGNHPYPYTVASQYGIGDGHGENQPLQHPKDFSGFLCNKLSAKAPVATYKEGGEIQIVIVQNAEHGGHHDFRICPKPWDTLKTDESKALCLDMHLIGCDSPKACGAGKVCKCGHQCTPANECGCYSDGCKSPVTNPCNSYNASCYSHGPPLTGSLVHGANVFNLTLPMGLSCEQCTLQWVWHTTRNGEQFANCADIKITKDPSSSRPQPSPAPSPKDSCRRRSCSRRRSSPSRRRRRRRSSRRRSTSRRRSSRRRRRQARRRSATSASTSREEYENLGCFPVYKDDRDAIGELQDMKCARAQRGPCRSGMPFYRLQMTTEPVQQCSSFCISKGLDLFGLLGSECRCGATQTNGLVWSKLWFEVHRGLALDFSTGLGDPTYCEGMRIFRHIGWLSAAPGEGLKQRTEEDAAYINSIVNGWRETS